MLAVREAAETEAGSSDSLDACDCFEMGRRSLQSPLLAEDSNRTTFIFGVFKTPYMSLKISPDLLLHAFWENPRRNESLLLAEIGSS